jgi:glycosyltransferase involved in cell wall biosynthesis
MKIAIQASDLDAERIDGTRVYIINLLRQFGKLDQDSQFLIYHKKTFNPELTPPDFSNYSVRKKSFPFFWTQTRFAWEMLREKPDVLWMPMQAVPLLAVNKIKTVVTIHDLAFKYFPGHFPSGDLRRLNVLTDMAISKSAKIIAVSKSTRNDILKFYPEISPEKVRIIHHGFDGNIFSGELPNDEINRILANKNLKKGKYILYVGAIQPRKSIESLILAFERIKNDHPDLKLVLAGEKGWLWEKTLNKIDNSSFRSDILRLGQVKVTDLPVLYQGAACFVFPSLYEGFGLPVLEAFACGCPVIVSDNSSLPEVAGDAALYFATGDSGELAEKILTLIENGDLRRRLIEEGKVRLRSFSWEKCARETLELFKS